MHTLRILIVDDSSDIRQSLHSLLSFEPDLEVVGFAENGRDGVQMALQLKPDVIIMNNSMPIMNGLEASEEILRCLSETAIVMLSAYSELAYRRAANDIGIFAYFVKPLHDFDEFCDTLRDAHISHKNAIHA